MDELPGEDIFNRLSGEERASHWQNARQRIAELNGQVQQAEQVKSLLNDYGGFEQVQASLDMLGGLFTPLTDEQGNIQYGEDGLPETTSAPFWQNLRERSPQTFVQMGEDWLYQEHSPGLQNWQVMFEHVFGLDPGKLDLYRSIQSPADAAQYQPAGDVSPYELEVIPQSLQPAYLATDADMRARLQEWEPEERDRYLQEKQSFLEERKSREMREAQSQQQAQEQRVENERRISNEAVKYALQVRQTHRQALKDELARSFSPTADPQINDRILNRCLDLTEHYVNNDPQVAPLVQNADYFFRMAYTLEQKGDEVRAAQAKYAANSATTRALQMVRKYLSEQVAFENARSTGFREGWEQKREQARGRTVLPRSEANGLPGSSFAPRPAIQPFSDARIAEVARSIALERQARSEGF